MPAAGDDIHAHARCYPYKNAHKNIYGSAQPNKERYGNLYAYSGAKRYEFSCKHFDTYKKRDSYRDQNKHGSSERDQFAGKHVDFDKDHYSSAKRDQFSGKYFYLYTDSDCDCDQDVYAAAD